MKKRFALTPESYLDTPERKTFLNRELFQEVAPRYNFITRALSFGRDAAWKKNLLQQLPPQPQSQCLDIACGTGDLTALLAQKYPQGSIAGLDLTPAMLEIAEKLHGQDRIAFIEGSIEQLPFDDQSMDVITGGYALRNAPDLATTLREIHRVLMPHGTAAFLDFSKPPHRLGQAVTLGLLRFWGGFWGLVLHGNPNVYGYIADSLLHYPDRVKLKKLCNENQLKIIRRTKCFLGILEIIVIQKEDAE